MLNIIADTPHFVVAAKPCGLDFHDCDSEPGFFTQLKQQLGDTELYPVHRLDKVTSGLIVVARDLETNQALCQQFADHRVEKFYLAIARGKPKKKQGAIIGDMVRSRRGSWKLKPSRNNPAVTSFFSYNLSPNLRLYLLKPYSGKTHQLRVAMKSLGTPILGDKLYSGSLEGAGSERVFLHAWQLGFKLNGNFCRFTLAPTGRFAELCDSALSAIGKPAELSWPAVR